MQFVDDPQIRLPFLQLSTSSVSGVPIEADSLGKYDALRSSLIAYGPCSLAAGKPYVAKLEMGLWNSTVD